jgi:uncharacterized OsmC-like protein
MKYYKVRGTGHGCASETEIADGRFIVRTDTPKRMGGQDTAPEPVDLMLAALIGCEQATAHFVAMKMRPTLKIENRPHELSA